MQGSSHLYTLLGATGSGTLPPENNLSVSQNATGRFITEPGSSVYRHIPKRNKSKTPYERPCTDAQSGLTHNSPIIEITQMSNQLMGSLKRGSIHSV